MTVIINNESNGLAAKPELDFLSDVFENIRHMCLRI